jgi:hypothetical protein
MQIQRGKNRTAGVPVRKFANDRRTLATAASALPFEGAPGRPRSNARRSGGADLHVRNREEGEPPIENPGPSSLLPSQPGGQPRPPPGAPERPAGPLDITAPSHRS